MKKQPKIKHIVILLLVVLVCTGCQPVAVPAEGDFELPVVTIQASPAVTRSALPAPSPTVRGTPTVDYQAKINQSALELQQSVASATVGAITQQVIDTNQAKLDAAAVKTSTVVISKSQTAEAQSIQTQNVAKTGTAQAPLTAREWVRTSWEPVLMAAYFVMVVLIGAFICWAIYALAYAKYTLMMAQVHLTVEAKVPELKPDERVTVQLDRRDEYGWGAVDWSTLPISKDVLRKVAELIVLHGARYNQAQMTGAGKPLIKDNTFDSFGAWMRLNKIALRLEDGRYVVQQRTFFEQVLNE